MFMITINFHEYVQAVQVPKITMQKLDIPLNNIMKLGPLLRNLFVVQGICDVGRKFITQVRNLSLAFRNAFSCVEVLLIIQKLQKEDITLFHCKTSFIQCKLKLTFNYCLPKYCKTAIKILSYIKITKPLMDLPLPLNQYLDSCLS